MKRKLNYLLALNIISFLCLSEKNAKNSFRYQVPSGKEIEANRYDSPNEIYPARLKPGNSRYRQPLLLKKAYIDNPKAHKELIKIYEKLRYDSMRQTKEKWDTPENIKLLIKFIKKYPDSSQAATAKLLLAEVVATPFFTDTLPSYYWSLDLFGEIYRDFPDKWQGKVALWSLYKNLFYPVPHCKTRWIYQFLDDYEAICWEMEGMYFDKNQEPGFKEYQDLLHTSVLHWELTFTAYCMTSKSRYMEEDGLAKGLNQKAKSIFKHMWELCKSGKHCELSQSYMKSLLKAKKAGDTHYGPCVPDKLE